MKRQVNIRASAATRQKLDALTERRYGTQAEAIAVAIDRLYQAEGANTMDEQKKHIRIEYSEASLFNGWAAADLETVDVPASVLAYGASLENYVYDAYPTAAIEIVLGIMDRVAINGDTDHPETPFVEDLVSKVYESDSWLTGV